MLHEVGFFCSSGPDERVRSNRDVSSWGHTHPLTDFGRCDARGGRRQRRGSVSGRPM